MPYIETPELQEKITNQIRLLQEEHREMDMLIQQGEQQISQMKEQFQRNYLIVTLRNAKKRKLRLKDRIAYLKSLLIPDIIA